MLCRWLISEVFMSLAFVTAARMSVSDQETHLLMEEVQRRGAACQLLAWDADIDWSRFSVVMLRSPWDYHERIKEFRAWAQQTSQVTQLLNPWPVLDWNSHKSYLLDLQQSGVPVMPTQLLPQGTSPAPGELGEGQFIAKPAIGIGASGIARGLPSAPDWQAHLHRLLQENDVLIQPYNSSIEERGETSLILIGEVENPMVSGSASGRGHYSHAVRKLPASGDYRVQKQHGGTVVGHEPSAAERAVAEQALSCVQHPVAYARVDLVHWQGQPVVMELELIEPELFLGRAPQAVHRLASLLLAVRNHQRR